MGPPTISIHALLAESDTIFAVRPYDAPIFLSTLSLRRATCDNTYTLGITDISIHALLAESDGAPRFGCFKQRYFYPRSPCGERHVACSYWHKLCHFYPRSPCGERLLRSDQLQPRIHPDFYPRSPCGERRKCAVSSAMSNDFYPRSPCGERLHPAPVPRRPHAEFLSTLSLRRATIRKCQIIPII